MSEKKELGNIFQRINKVMQEVTTVNKGTTVSITSSNSYKAVSHDDVTGLLHKPITDAGIVALPNMESCELEEYVTESEYQGRVTKKIGYRVKVWASVTFFNIDKPEEKVETKCYAYALDSGDKATGKAYSMAVKYCYLKTFMLESQDEEESRDNEKTYNDNRGNQNNGGNRNQNNQQRQQNNNQQGNDTKKASPAQLGALKKLLPADHEIFSVDPDTITAKVASELIQANQPKGK
jgi:tRNA U38,U39,U40 pseudouridine synthase TruA